MVNYSNSDYLYDLKTCNVIIKKYFSDYKNFSKDLRNIGLFGAYKGRHYWSKEKSQLNTYLWACIYTEMLLFIKRFLTNDYQNNDVSLNTTISQKDVSLTLEDVFSDSFNFDDYDDTLVLIDILKKYLKGLNGNKKIATITKLIIKGYTSSEIAVKCDVSISYVNRVKQEFKFKLKNLIKKELH